MKRNAIVVILIFWANILFAQYGYDSPYNYSRWISELSVTSSVIGQQGNFSLNGVDYDIAPVYEKPKWQENWSMSAKYEGRYDLLIFLLSGAATQTGDLQSGRKVSSLTAQAETAIGVMLWNRFYILGGGRYFNMELKVENADDPLPQEFKNAWIDPFAGVRYEIPFTRFLMLRLRGDVGGFRLGSELSYNAAAFLRFSMGNAALELGARGYALNLEQKNEIPLTYEMVTAGPSLGFTIWF